MISRANWAGIANIDGATVNRVLPPIVNLLLVVVIAWQVAKMIWMLVPGSAVGGTVIAPVILSNPVQSSTDGPDVAAIADSHIFGVADAESATPVLIVAPEDDLPDTRINLTLNGTVASEIPRYSVAIISDGGKDQEVYVIGESVGNNATLHAIYADRVVLNEKGVLTSLKLPREFKDDPMSSVRRETTTTRQSFDDTQSIQAVVTQNLTRLTDVIRPTPYRVGGEQVGFRVYPGRDRKQFEALGLKSGDVITDIDGQSLSDASQAMQIFQSLGSAEEVTVTLDRDGQIENLTLRTSQLDLSDEQTQ